MIKDISFPKVDLACQLTKKDISEFYELQGIKEQQNELVKPDPISNSLFLIILNNLLLNYYQFIYYIQFKHLRKKIQKTKLRNE